MQHLLHSSHGLLWSFYLLWVSFRVVSKWSSFHPGSRRGHGGSRGLSKLGPWIIKAMGLRSPPRPQTFNGISVYLPFGTQTWRAGKFAINGGFNRKVFDFPALHQKLIRGYVEHMGFKDDSNPSEREKMEQYWEVSFIRSCNHISIFLGLLCVCHIYIIIYNYIYSICVYISDTERSTVSLCVFGMFVSYIFIQQIL